MLGLNLINYTTRSHWQDVRPSASDSRGMDSRDIRVIQPNEKIEFDIDSDGFNAKPGDIVEFHADIYQFNRYSIKLIPAELKRKYPDAVPISELTDTQHYACVF